MQTTGDRAGDWQTPLEADAADVSEQARALLDSDDVDPEVPAAAPAVLRDLDLAQASEADLAEQLYEVPFDDDGDR